MMKLLWVACLVLLGCMERWEEGHALLLAVVLWLLWPLLAAVLRLLRLLPG